MHRGFDCIFSNVEGERVRALLQEDAGLEGNLFVLAEEVLRRRPVFLSPIPAYQHPQLVVPARMLTFQLDI